MPRWQQRRERLRSVLFGTQCVYPGSVFDPISARIAEELGFEIGMFAGSIASLTVLGAPDLILLTLTEFAEQAHRICRAGNLPLLCDADHGYGNALNVMRTVEELETAGVAGLSIEDTELPAAFGGKQPRLISIEEGIGKMRAALAARRDTALVIAGRTSSPVINGIADTIERARAYEAAGVDAIFLVGLKSRADLDAVAAQVKLPLILGGAGKELMDRDWLAGRGVRICLQGHQPFTAAVRAIHDTLRALRDGVPPEAIGALASDETMKRLTGTADYARWMKDWL
ncbi:MAG TPA: isocitrate lyase/phosphoenolpyruvate mutase family protein [Burkholderiales bacterium]|nr:isocitrate lyase/phosphoenolpyruvate mutase family protein [Burkholderiales bacterium]